MSFAYTRNQGPPTTLVFLTDGFEEEIFVTIIVALRRQGQRVKTVALVEGNIRGSYGISLQADMLIGQAQHENVCAFLLPGSHYAVRQLLSDPRFFDLIQQTRHGEFPTPLFTSAASQQAVRDLFQERSPYFPPVVLRGCASAGAFAEQIHAHIDGADPLDLS